MPQHPDFSDKIDPAGGPAACERVHQHLEALVDGELAQPVEAAMRRHLATCAPCTAAHAEAIQIALSLRSLPELACPPQVTRAVLAQAAAEHAQRPARAQETESATVHEFPTHQPVRWRPALAAALIAAAVGSALFFYPRSVPPTQSTETVRLSAREIAEAEIELKLTLAYIAEVGREAGLTVRDEMVENIFAPTHRALR